MKKIKKQKLILQKTSVIELNVSEMNKIIGGTGDVTTINDPSATISIDTGINPRTIFTTCSSNRTK